MNKTVQRSQYFYDNYLDKVCSYFFPFIKVKMVEQHCLVFNILVDIIIIAAFKYL